MRSDGISGRDQHRQRSLLDPVATQLRHFAGGPQDVLAGNPALFHAPAHMHRNQGQGEIVFEFAEAQVGINTGNQVDGVFLARDPGGVLPVGAVAGQGVDRHAAGAA